VAEVILKESFISGTQGTHWSPRPFLRSWILTGGCFSYLGCLTAELLPDRFNFRLFSLPLGCCAPFAYPTVLLSEIEKIEMRKGAWGFKTLFSLVPKPTTDPRKKTFLRVRRPDLWLKHFKNLAIKVDDIGAP